MLVDAAQRLFEQRGYATTTMKDVSSESGIALSVLYHHFPSKADLLREAVVMPFVASMDEFGEAWYTQLDAPRDEQVLLRSFLLDLHGNLVRHRSALVALLAAREELDEEIETQIARSMRRMFMELRSIGQAEAQMRRWFSPDEIELSVRLIVAMVAGSAVFDELFLPESALPSDVDVFEHMSALILWGLSRRRPDRTDREN